MLSKHSPPPSLSLSLTIPSLLCLQAMYFSKACQFQRKVKGLFTSSQDKIMAWVSSPISNENYPSVIFV